MECKLKAGVAPDVLAPKVLAAIARRKAEMVRPSQCVWHFCKGCFGWKSSRMPWWSQVILACCSADSLPGPSCTGCSSSTLAAHPLPNAFLRTHAEVPMLWQAISESSRNEGRSFDSVSTCMGVAIPGLHKRAPFDCCCSCLYLTATLRFRLEGEENPGFQPRRVRGSSKRC